MSLLTSLVSYWKLDEASGNALDAHGSNHLTETSGTIGAAAGRITGARDFESIDTEYFELADNPDLSTGDIAFTFACWVMPESLSSLMVIAQKGWSNVGEANAEWALYYNPPTSRPVFRVCGGTTLSSGSLSPASDLTIGQWNHLLVQHDPVGNTVGISLNGAALVLGSHSAGVNDGNRAFRIGARNDANWFWDGLICEAGFWKRLLTSTERAQLYNNGNGLAYPLITGARRRRLLMRAA